MFKKLVAGIACSAMMVVSMLGGVVSVDAQSAYTQVCCCPIVRQMDIAGCVISKKLPLAGQKKA